MAVVGKYVCAFRGRRDYYQVPLALAECGSLERFITDAYAGPLLRTTAALLPNRLRAIAQFRHAAGIPDEVVSCLWGTTAVEHLRHRMGCSPSLTFARLDQNFSHAAEHWARRTRSHLLLYSPYAWEAFTASYPHGPRKVLFQYHPHPDFERRILAADHAQYPVIAASYAEASGARLDESLRQRERDCWRHADMILCASSFTRLSLVAAGADPQQCHVIPYGMDVPQTGVTSVPECFHALFVGLGVQRKGLHHLLLAWQRATLPQNSSLTLVCRSIDPELERRAAETACVRLLRGVSADQLTDLFRSSTLFVMPSLVEGFGQVYLEALVQGCPVLGTPNTALPDLGSEGDGIFMCAPGNVEELTVRLECLSRCLPANASVREAARKVARTFTWVKFRHSLVSVLEENA